MNRILVVGDLNVDLIGSGITDLPALGREVLLTEWELAIGGSSALCATGLARLGASVSLVSRVGNDSYGDFLLHRMLAEGVDVNHVVRDSVRKTGLTIAFAFAGDRALVTCPGCISALCGLDLAPEILSGYCHLHVGSYFLQTGLQDTLPELFDAAHRRGLTVSLDPGTDPTGAWGGERLWKLLPQIDIFLPNELEACAIADRSDVAKATERLADRTRCVVTKRGAAGAMARCDGASVADDALPVHVVDTTGAGDSFDAGFLYAFLTDGTSLRAALSFANACGALSATALGGSSAQPSLNQVRQCIRDQRMVPIPKEVNETSGIIVNVTASSRPRREEDGTHT